MSYEKIIELIDGDDKLAKKIKKYCENLETANEFIKIKKILLEANASTIEPKILNQLLNSVINFTIKSKTSATSSVFEVSFNMVDMAISLCVGSDPGYIRRNIIINDIQIKLNYNSTHIEIESFDDIENESNRKKLTELFHKNFPNFAPNHVLTIILNILKYFIDQ